MDNVPSVAKIAFLSLGVLALLGWGLVVWGRVQLQRAYTRMYKFEDRWCQAETTIANMTEVVQLAQEQVNRYQQFVLAGQHYVMTGDIKPLRQGFLSQLHAASQLADEKPDANAKPEKKIRKSSLTFQDALGA